MPEGREMKKLFSERHGAGAPRVKEVLDEKTRDGLIAVVVARINDESFGYSFASSCADGYRYAGTDTSAMRARMETFSVLWPFALDANSTPTDGQVFDLIEFSYETIAHPTPGAYHSYMSHTHFTYDRELGRAGLAEEVNRVFEHNGIAFELKDGEIVRVAGTPLQEALADATYQTGDAFLNALLEDARSHFLNRRPEVRLRALEKIWDAWERLKTLEGPDKLKSSKLLLDKVTAEPTFRERLEREARELTDIGNAFMIRHFETSKVPITNSSEIDYLFHRMFALIRLILRATSRGN
jgi:hypothetical protein